MNLAANALLSQQFMTLLGLLLDDSSALVGLKDLDGVYVFANRELEKMLGAQPGGVVGHRDSDFMPESVAEDIARREQLVTRGEPPQRAAEDLALPSGMLHCATVRFAYRDEAGRLLGTAFFAIDIHDRREPIGETDDALKQAEQTISELKDAVEELRVRVTTDRLTGALTRSRIEESARHEISRMARYGHPVSLLFIDLDNFKEINDGLGHLVGDQVLHEFCGVVRRRMRDTDLLGRWGGEEFVLLCPHTVLSSACQLAERLRSAITAHRFEHVGKVTASLGVAECLEHEDYEQWLARADAAVYRAKRAGRNRVEADPRSSFAGRTDRIDHGFVRLVWDRTYECGHSRLDTQHRVLFDYANTLLVSVMGRMPKQEVAPLLDTLMLQVKQHFEEEEAIIRAAGYPDADAHAVLHAALLEEGRRIRAAYANDEVGLGALFQYLAHDIIAAHFLREDARYFPYLSKSA